MRVQIIGNYLRDQQRSMLRFESEVVRGLSGQSGVKVACSRPVSLIGRSRGRAGKWLRYVDKYLVSPMYLVWSARSADVIHIIDHSNAIYIPLLRFCRARVVVTCHDMLAVDSAADSYSSNSVGKLGKLLQRLIKKGLSFADGIACVSIKTELDLRRVVKLKQGAVLFVIPLCLSPEFETSSSNIKSKDVDSRRASNPYWVHVGSDAWYKNRTDVIRLFSAILATGKDDSNLLLVGPALSVEDYKVAIKLGCADRVINRENLSDEELKAVYADAEGLLFLSLAEGFGWPVIEAQASNCVVYANPISPVVENSGGYIVEVDLLDIENSADLIVNLPPETRESIREAGRINARRFSRETMGLGYHQLFDAVVSDSLGGRP